MAKVSPSMKNQIFAIAEKRNETAATVMREMIRMLRQVRNSLKNKPPLVWRLESDSKIFY
ncbi:hypothetical protein EZJ55_00460 [Microcystis aeruginosa EAWAG127a]|uniref:Ribbon-helix-helix protein, CopG family n=1 Tax=Microcystis aeruginosa EAWAG127a TaxID=2529855 RepID=A0A5J5M0U2_MICAE|nr:hypothetical protein [Microcystis aeruginosa]KAB0244048.1 hypothetical protein EZJ55_00460 [Microcystis aeruginosa EAWAG127a]